MAVRSILVATDFSDCARGALELALELAGNRARITLAHAWSAPRISGGVGTAPLVQMPGLPGVTLTDYVRDDADRSLRALAADLGARGVRNVETYLALGDPRDVLVELSQNHDLIVMGTHGRGGLSRLILGSVADYVVRHARCPVVTVR